MTKKNLHIVVVLFVGIVAGFLGGYLFKQSSKLKQVNKNQVLSEKNTQISQSSTANNTHVEEKNKIFKKDLLAEISSPQIKQDQDKEKTLPKTTSTTTTIKKWINEYVITPYFIEDLVDFILDSYEPPNTKDNPTQKPILNISLKALNARYGLELIGFKVEAPSVERARKKILDKIMDPDLLKAQYEKYSDIFINELIEEAKVTTKKFTQNGKTIDRQLNTQEIKILLVTLSDYIKELSLVLHTISNDKNLLKKLNLYLEADKQSTHYNYLLNQLITKYNLEKQKHEQSQDTESNNILEELKKEREKAVKEYERSLRRRERLRSQLIEVILKKDPNIRFTTSEILYIFEWAHRRIKQGKSLENIDQLATILDLVSDKLKKREISL